MEASLLKRLDELRAERATGLARLDELASEFERTRETVLRIAGAVQVLEELLAVPADPVPADPVPADPVPADPAG